MASKTTWICDWCGVREVESNYPFPEDWAHFDPHTFNARRGRGQHNEIPLFPKEMAVEKTAEHPSHYETEFCGECLQAILDALKNVRELRIAKKR